MVAPEFCGFGGKGMGGKNFFIYDSRSMMCDEALLQAGTVEAQQLCLSLSFQPPFE